MKNNQKGSANAILIIAVVILAGIVVYLSWPEDNSTPPPTELETFSATYDLKGQHNTSYKLTVAFKYSPADFTIDRDKLEMKEVNGNIHTIQFPNLEAFGGPLLEYVKGQRIDSFCQECGTIANNLNIPGVTEILTVANDKEEWIFFSSPQTGNVIAGLKKPSDKAKKILETLSVKLTYPPQPSAG